MPQRIPSPRELQQHTQNIMQQALIKKKLEEQREKFIKKQEIIGQRSMSPDSNTGHIGASPAKHLSPTPHSFTPTSVLRKMTASKENESLLSAITKDKSNSISNNNQLANEQTLKQISLQRENSLTSLTGQTGSQVQGRAVTGMRQSQPPSVGLNSNVVPHMSGWNAQQQQISSLKQGKQTTIHIKLKAMLHNLVAITDCNPGTPITG